MKSLEKRSLAEVHNLKLIRNNRKAQKCAFDDIVDLKKSSPARNVFFMLDYFDFMEHMQLTEEGQGYIAFTDMVQDINHRSGVGISSKAIGLYRWREKEEKAEETVFSLPGKEERKYVKSLSSHPFLGMVQIFIHDYQYAGKLDDVEKVEDMLMRYEGEIERVMRLKNEREQKQGMEYTLYRSIATADFCLMIRSSSLTQIYECVSEILSIHSGNEETECKRLFNTYTHIGIECVCFENMFFSFSNETIRKNDNIKFAIRFSFSADFNDQILQLKEIGRGKIDVVNGLFGRYDAVVRVSMSDFAKLYPYLCKSKMGMEFSEKEKGVVRSSLNGKDERLIKMLIEGIMENRLWAVNERALLGIDECEFNRKEQMENPAANIHNEFVKNQNTSIRKRYREIGEKYGENFLCRKSTFWDIYHLLGSVIEAYEALGYEQDTHINWYICTEYFEQLFDKMEDYLENMEDSDEERKKFLLELQSYVKAMNEYTRLLQAVNQHTMQAPQYDVVSPMDAEKFLIAYSEYMHSLDEKHYNYDWKSKENVCQERRKRCSVVIYPEMSKNKLELTEVITRDKILHEEGDSDLPALLICTLPSFEYFERPYDMIPLISHEMFHHVLVLERGKRNEYLIKRIIRAIFKKLCMKMNMKALEESLYVHYSYLVDLFAEEFSSCFFEAFQKQEEEWEKFLMMHIVSSVMLFFEKMMGRKEALENSFYVEDYYNHQTPSLEGEKAACQVILSMAWKEYGRMEKEKIEEVERLIKDIEELAKGNEEKLNQTTVRKYKKRVELIVKELIEQCGRAIPALFKISCDEMKGMTDKEWDVIIYKKMQAYLKGEENNITADELKEYYEKLRLLHKNMERLRNSLSFCSGKKQECEEVIVDAVKRIKDKIYSVYQNPMCAGFYIYGEEEAAVINYWGVMRRESEWAKEQIQIFFQKEDLEEYYKEAKREEIIYRETCADLFMCSHMRLNSFGYLRMAASIWGRMGGYEEEMNAGFVNAERLKHVLCVLLVKEGAEQEEQEWMGKNYIRVPIEGLYKELQSFQENSLKCAKERIARMAAQEDEGDEEFLEQLEDYFMRMKCMLDYMQKAVWNNGRIVVEGSPLEELFMKNETQFEKNSKLKRYLQKEINVFFRLVYILKGISENQRNGYFIIEEPVFHHYQQIYENPCTEMEAESDLFKGEVHDTVRRVAQFYNQPDSEGKEGTSNRDKLKQMLRFVQDYYYYNRMRKYCDEQQEIRSRKEA